MPGIVSAWIVGEAIIFWRNWKQQGAFPVPGQLIAASFIFAMLALLAESQKARGLATTMAWGFDIAALLNVLPDVLTGGTNTSTGQTVAQSAETALQKAHAAATAAGGLVQKQVTSTNPTGTTNPK